MIPWGYGIQNYKTGANEVSKSHSSDLGTGVMFYVAAQKH